MPSIEVTLACLLRKNFLLQEDQEVIRKMRLEGARLEDIYAYIKKKITQQREAADKKKNEWKFDMLFDQCITAVPNSLEKILGKDMSKKLNSPLDKNRVHLVGDYDFISIA